MVSGGFFFGCEACGILAPQLGIKPGLAALEDKVLINGPLGKVLRAVIFESNFDKQNSIRLFPLLISEGSLIGKVLFPWVHNWSQVGA